MDILHGKLVLYRFQMGKDGHHTAQSGADVRLKILGNVVCVVDGPLTGDKDVHRNEAPRRCLAGAQGMKIDAFLSVFLHHILY